MTRTQKALVKMARALRGLEADQGRLARRNARRKVSAAARALVKAVDAEFPMIRKPHAVAPNKLCDSCGHDHVGVNPCPQNCGCQSYIAPRARRSHNARTAPLERIAAQKRRLRARGFVKLSGIPLPIVAQARIRTILTRDGESWVPEWVTQIAPSSSAAEVRRCKRDIAHRKALIAAYSMTTRFQNRATP
jgi:hypothetical protein